jgi:tetratricopeptide (TPR) repeat protein
MADLFAQALAFQQAGRLAEAESLCRAILDSSPNHGDALNLRGIIARKRGNPAQAVELILSAIAANPKQPLYQHALAAAYCDLGRFDEAIECCQTALRLQPDKLESQLSLGLAFQAAKRWPDAEHTFRYIAERWSNAPYGPQALGDCWQAQGKVREAIAAYQEALRRRPDAGGVHLVLGTLLLTTEAVPAAEPHLRRAVELLPKSIAAMINFGSCLRNLKREREALEYYYRALPLAPHDLILKVNIGLALLGCGKYHEAEGVFAEVLKSKPEDVSALCGMGVALRETQRPDEAIPLYQHALRIDPASDAYRGLADALWDVSNVDEAERVLRVACDRHPRDAEARSRLATILIAKGDFEAATAMLRQALEFEPHHPQALTELARLMGRDLPPETRTAMDEATRRPASPAALSGLHFAIAHVEDARDNFALAAEHLRQANSLAKTHWSSLGKAYDSEATSGKLRDAIAIFGPPCFERTAGFGDPTDQLVFVVGMQRSGTSLVEQILASHPRVFGVGEQRTVSQSLLRLPAVMGLELDAIECVGRITREAVQDSARWCLQELRKCASRPAERIVDKTPNNYLFLGWLHMLFPNARFIHCKRDLRDVALSCWMTHFSSIHWSNDLGNIASQILDYRAVMQHWKERLPAPILEVEYEKLVGEQESESRRLIEWIGLEWDPACLDFYQTRRAVRTASVTQVRKPIYTRSIGRWRHYVDSLRPLIEDLGLGFD